MENFLPFSANSKLSSANSFNLEESKICRLEKVYSEKHRDLFFLIFCIFFGECRARLTFTYMNFDLVLYSPMLYHSGLSITSPSSAIFNSLPNDKFLDITKLKAFADGKLYFTSMTIPLFDRLKNAVRKGENAGYQHFLLFPQCFPKLSSLGS